jgi:CHAD domain-containing protein
LRSISTPEDGESLIRLEHYAQVGAAQLDLLLPDPEDRSGALALLQERLSVQVGREQTRDRTLLDSFDGRLRAAGLRAERADRSLTLHEPGAAVRRAQVASAPRYLVEELPAGPLRDRLAGVLEERALLPAVRVRSDRRSLAVLNADAKTVVRLTLEAGEVVLDGGRRVALAPRLTVQPVLGYDADHARALRVLRDQLGFRPAERPLFDEAAVAAGRLPEGISTKPKVELARGTRTDAAGSEVLLRLLEIAEVNVPGTLDDLDTEFLHDLRVSIRRARSVLRELKDVHEPRARQKLRDELKWAQQLTGPVRDLDVQLLEWSELVVLLPPERAAELDPLRQLLAGRRSAELAKLRRGLRSKRFAAALEAWRTLPADPDGANAARPIEAVAGERIRRVYRRMVRDGSAIDDTSPAEALHDLRKRGKELRYLLELFGSPFPKSVVKPMVSTLKDLQEVLGRFQDRAVQIELLQEVREELAGQPGGPAALMAAGTLIDALVADQHAARDHFAETFSAFAAKPQRKLVRDAFPGS